MLLWNDTVRTRFLDRLSSLMAGCRNAIYVQEIPLAGAAWLAWSLHILSRRTVLWLSDGPRSLDDAMRNLQTLCPPDTPPPLIFPSWEVIPGERAAPPSVETTALRISMLEALLQKQPRLIATNAQALMELTLAPEVLGNLRIELQVGHEADPEILAKQLETAGYVFGPEVQAPGEASRRGGLLDVWPPTAPSPLRLEFLGQQVESIRIFDPAGQSSTSRAETASLPPPSEWRLLKQAAVNGTHLARYLPDDAIVVWADAESIAHHAAIYESALRESNTPGYNTSFEEVRQHLTQRPPASQVFLYSAPAIPCDALDPGITAIPPVVTVTGRQGLHPDVLEQARTRLLKSLAACSADGTSVVLCFDTQGTRDRFADVYGSLLKPIQAHIEIAPLTGGFLCHDPPVRIVTEPDLYGRKLRRRHAGTSPRIVTGARVSDWTDMDPGDLVVHIEHGVGRYLGLREITVAGQLQEALAIEYADKAKLYVPVAQAHLLTRYVGAGKKTMPLHPLGGKRWGREKEAAEKAIQDFAGTLLETQAARDSQQGFAHPADTPWQHEMENAFPYEETDDQAAAIREVKRDMEVARPMDRLLCGDAGYGKTEVAVRAAFKSVMAGKQVAVLVPTTVLAQQHFQTFMERIAPFPVRIEMLSRFGSRSDNAAIVSGLAAGTVDIVIGTHALLQPGVLFRDLGLVIIDEEQRFGVRHKERFKHMRRLVDVLTLTATPIPRTLYMSLTGARDLSTIQTPPQERLMVETIVYASSAPLIREAILREINREGQVFFVHNRVHSISRLYDQLQRLVPEASFEVAHGQMAPTVLSDVMRRFASGEFDVLICTTIVESGVDIPNANTILIDRADRFGLSELYQLRGRVGRSKHKAYAYMLLPPQSYIDTTARRRIQAITQYSGAGAGFRLAMRDLEIRGAGNLLGAAQSGHIAAVGFGLYCQLLRRTIATLKGETLPPVIDVDVRLDFISLSPSDTGAPHVALIPSRYIDDERIRVSMYRRIAEAGFIKEVKALRSTFRDRFGPLPPECERLLTLSELRILAAERGITTIQVEADKLMLKQGEDYLMHGGRFPRLKASDPDARLGEIVAHVRRLPSPTRRQH